LSLGINELYFQVNSIKSKAYVIDVKEKKDNDGSIFYYPVYEYTLPNGRKYKKVSSMGTAQNYVIGEILPISYLKEYPYDAHINHFFNNWAFTILMGIISCFFSIIGVFSLLWSKKRL
jgi:hypothetical protein